MPRLILAAVVMIAVWAPAHPAAAQTVQWPVTPTQLDYSNFVFAVTTQAASGGTAFHVTITTNTQPIQPDSAASLANVTGTGAVAPVVSPLDPAVQVTLKRTDQVWTADFTVPNETLSSPTVYFIFVVTDYRTNADGTRSYLPTDRMYEIKLRDFLKPAPGF